MATSNTPQSQSPEPSDSDSSALGRIKAEIRQSEGGMLPFSEVMRLALYADGCGYYSSGRARIGKGGDFFTSVSAGPCFGMLLAHHYKSLWQSCGEPEQFLAIEQGAHDGQLAKDLLAALEELGTPLRDRLSLCLVEPSENWRTKQRQNLGDSLGDRLIHVDDVIHLADLAQIQNGVRGAYFSNELLDAFPVHRVKFQDGQWQERFVTIESDRLVFISSAPGSLPVAEALEELPKDLPEGYETEVQLAASDWIADVARSGFRGELCLIDYGFTRDEYFALHRNKGTIRRYRNHKSDGEVLEDLGDADLTAHVEFSSVIERAEAEGLELIELTDQHHFLIRLATPWLQQLEREGKNGDNEPRIRQFQTLVHPSSMGSSFKVLRFNSGAANC